MSQAERHHKIKHEQKAIRRERWALLRTLICLTRQPMIILAFVWLALLILDLSIGLNQPLEILAS